MFSAQGERGRLLAVYAEAAALGRWRCTAGEELGMVTTFDAAILRSSDLLLRYRPLTIALRFGDCEWRWTLRDDLHVSDGTLRGSAIGVPVVYPKGA